MRYDILTQSLEDFSLKYGVDFRVVVFLFTAILVWTLAWKLLAMWKAAKKDSVTWFILLAVINTIGILEILYLYVFSRLKSKRPAKQTLKTNKK